MTVYWNGKPNRIRHKMAQLVFGAFIGSDNLRQPQVIVTRPPGRTDVDLTENDLAISRESLGSWTMDDLYLMSFRNTQMDCLDAWNAARIGKQQDSDAARIRKKQDSDADTFPITDGSLEDILRDLPRGPHGLTASLVDCALRILLHGWRDNVNKRRDRATCASDLLQSEDGRLRAGLRTHWCAIRRSSRLPIATWIMASETSRRFS